jgi:hypothetical protein
MLNDDLFRRIGEESIIILLAALCFFNYYLPLFILFFGPKKLEKIASFGFIFSLISYSLLVLLPDADKLNKHPLELMFGISALPYFYFLVAFIVMIISTYFYQIKIIKL